MLGLIDSSAASLNPLSKRLSRIISECREGSMLSVRAVFLTASLLLSAWLVQAQITNVTNSTSTPTPGSGHDYIKMLNETVNPANGSVSIRIAPPVPQARGLTIPFTFAYDTNGALVLYSDAAGGGAGFSSNTTFLSQSGWSYGVPLLSEHYIYKTHQTANGQNI